MKVNSLDDDQRGLTRRQLLGLATLTSAGLAAASVGVPEAKAAGATMLLKPGALREMHWHPNADEWQFYLSGQARITIFGAHGRTKTETFGPGQVGFIKQGFGHFIEQIGDEPTKVLILFNSPAYEEINISTWLAANPLGIITDNFGISRELADRLPRKSIVIAAPSQSGLSST
jgi:oxalate decarboxylase